MYKILYCTCEVLVVRNTKEEQWAFKPQAHRKQNIRALYLEAQDLLHIWRVLGMI